SLTQNLFHGLAALGSNFLGADQTAQAVEGGGDHVAGVVGAQALGTDVLDAGNFQDRTNRAAGDHAGTGGGGTHQDAAGAELAQDLVGDGGALHVDLVHVLLGGFQALADGLGDLAGLAHAKTDGA